MCRMLHRKLSMGFEKWQGGEGTAEAPAIAKEVGAALTLEREVKHISEKGSAGWAKAKEGSGIGEGTAAHIAREQACDARERNSTRAMQVRGGEGTCGQRRF